MYYQPGFLDAAWQDYRSETGLAEAEIDPDAFVRWTYARALAHRQPIYAAMARNWGLRIGAEAVAAVETPADFITLIGEALDRASRDAQAPGGRV